VPPVAIGNETGRSPWVVGDVPDVNAECTGILNKRNRRRKRATIPLPAETTLKFRTIRGCVRVADVVAPTIQAVVRNHCSYNAQEGAELEGDPFHVGITTASKMWEAVKSLILRRIFNTTTLMLTLTLEPVSKIT